MTEETPSCLWLAEIVAYYTGSIDAIWSDQTEYDEHLFRWLIVSRALVDNIERPVNVWVDMRIDYGIIETVAEEVLIAADCNYIEQEKLSVEAGYQRGQLIIRDDDYYMPERLAQIRSDMRLMRYLDNRRVARLSNQKVRRVDARIPPYGHVSWQGEIEIKTEVMTADKVTHAYEE